MEPLNFYVMTIIIVAIFLMAAQNMSMLSGKWRNYYVVLFFVKILLTSICSAYPGMVPMSGNDWWDFTYMATCVLENNPNSFFEILQSDASLFVKETAAVFYFLGLNPVYMYFLVCFGSLVAFKYMVLLAKEMTENDELAQKCGVLYLVWPILLVFASTFLRENQCQLLFILSLYNFILFIKKHRQINFVFSIGWAILAAMTHSGMIALVICYCLLGTMVSKSGKIKISPVRLIFGVIFIVILFASPFSSNMTEKFDGAENARSVGEFTAIVSKDSMSHANTNYASSIPSNPIKLLLFEPYLLLMFIFSPLPYQVHTVSQGIAFLIDTVPQFYLVRATFLYIFVTRKEGALQIRSYKKIGMCIILIFYLIFSLSTLCYGTAIRHRAKITPMLIVFSVMYYAEKRGVVVGSKEEAEWTLEEKRTFASFISGYLRKRASEEVLLNNSVTSGFVSKPRMLRQMRMLRQKGRSIRLFFKVKNPSKVERFVNLFLKRIHSHN